MTKEQFIASVESKPNFIKWASAPVLIETIGDIEKHSGVAYITTPDGTNTFNVWFCVDKTTGEASWQNRDQLEPEKNSYEVKRRALETYLKANFNAYFVVAGRVDYDNNWAEAEVFTLTTGKLTKKNVLVYKQGNNPISHLDII